MMPSSSTACASSRWPTSSGTCEPRAELWGSTPPAIPVAQGGPAVGARGAPPPRSTAAPHAQRHQPNDRAAGSWRSRSAIPASVPTGSPPSSPGAAAARSGHRRRRQRVQRRVHRHARRARRRASPDPRRPTSVQRLRRTGAGHDPRGVLEASLRPQPRPPIHGPTRRPRPLPPLLQYRPRPHRPTHQRKNPVLGKAKMFTCS